MVTKNLLVQSSHSAIVGQEEMKLALQLNVLIKIGGVMIMGDRGTGKSTTIRAMLIYFQKLK
jgi:Mg-chelatase subunit ChlI